MQRWSREGTERAARQPHRVHAALLEQRDAAPFGLAVELGLERRAVEPLAGDVVSPRTVEDLRVRNVGKNKANLRVERAGLNGV